MLNKVVLNNWSLTNAKKVKNKMKFGHNLLATRFKTSFISNTFDSKIYVADTYFIFIVLKILLLT
jgi:hypothetical protein